MVRIVFDLLVSILVIYLLFKLKKSFDEKIEKEEEIGKENKKDKINSGNHTADVSNMLDLLQK